MDKDKILKLAEDYANSKATWYVERLYGTSQSHTERQERQLKIAKAALEKALAAPAQPAQPLTDDKIIEFWIDAGWPDCSVKFKKTVRKVEAAHGIKEKKNG
jgi:hypothetical protein